MKARSYQSGSIASFIIIGVVLVILTAGALYWVRHKDTPVTPNKTPAVSVPSNSKETTPEDKEEKPDEVSPPAPATPPAPVVTQPAPAPQPTVTSLSQTGPADTMLQLIAIGALALTVAGFVRSRNPRSSL